MFLFHSKSPGLLIHVSIIFHVQSLSICPMAQMQSYHYDTTPIPIKGKEPPSASCPSASSEPFSYKRRRPLTHATFVMPETELITSRSVGALDVPRSRRSNTWTSSSGDLGLLSEGDQVDDREDFVNEYNRLAKRVTRSFE